MTAGTGPVEYPVLSVAIVVTTTPVAVVHGVAPVAGTAGGTEDADEAEDPDTIERALVVTVEVVT